MWDVERLRFATDAAGVGLWSWNVDTDKISLDEKAHDLWGVPASSSITFEDLSTRIHPEDLDKVRAAFAATRNRFGPYETDFRILRGSAIHWVSARGRGDDEGIRNRIMYGVFIDVTFRKLAEEARDLMAGEMHHRIKNIFALTSALAGFASRTTKTKEEMASDLSKRLSALSKAHDLLRPDDQTQSRAIELRDLFDVVLKPYLLGNSDLSPVTISMPQCLIGEHSATSLALIMHELATNSAKYGALSSPTGKLTITGDDLGGDIEIIWKESGGPPVVSSPLETGFGSKLMMASVKDQLGGTVEVDWPVDGIAVVLKFRKARLGA